MTGPDDSGVDRHHDHDDAVDPTDADVAPVDDDAPDLDIDDVDHAALPFDDHDLSRLDLDDPLGDFDDADDLDEPGDGTDDADDLQAEADGDETEPDEIRLHDPADASDDGGGSGVDAEHDAWDDDIPPDHGTFGPAAVVGWAEDGALAGVDLASFSRAVESLELDPLDLDCRQTVHILDHLGVDARVDHGTLDTLVDHVRSGGRLEITSGDQRFVVDRFDDLRDSMVLTQATTGAQVEMPLERFELGWASAAYEMVVADGDSALALISLPVDTSEDAAR